MRSKNPLPGPLARGASLAALLGLVTLTLAAADINKSLFTMATAKVAKGDKALESGDAARAEKHYRKAIEVEPAVPTGHLGLGAALVAQQRFPEALEVLAEAEVRFVAWQGILSEADLQQRQLTFRDSQGAQDLDAAGRQGARPATPSGDAATTKTFAEMGRNTVGTQQFLASERWKMDEVRAIPAQVFYLEGIAHLRSRQPERGADALELCLLLEPGHGLAHYNLAVALFGRGAPLEAKPHLDAAVEAGVEPHPAFVADLERALARLRTAAAEPGG